MNQYIKKKSTSLKAVTRSRRNLLMVGVCAVLILIGACNSSGATIGDKTLYGIFPVLAFIFGKDRLSKIQPPSLSHKQRKFREPEFWITIIGGMVPVINEYFGLGLSAGEFTTALTGLIGLILGRKYFQAGKEKKKSQLGSSPVL